MHRIKNATNFVGHMKETRAKPKKKTEIVRLDQKDYKNKRKNL